MSDFEGPVTVTCIIFKEHYVEEQFLPLFGMLKSQLTIKIKKPKQSKGEFLNSKRILFYKYRKNQLKTHPNYKMESSGDWDMSIYKCSLKEMSTFYFCLEYFWTNYYFHKLKRYPSLSLMNIMNMVDIYFSRDIRKKGSGEKLKNVLQFERPVKFECFDGLPKHFVKAAFVQYDGNFKRLVCESEGFIYFFDYCTS